MQQVLIFIIAAVFGAVATFYLQKYGLTSVVASCIVGLTGALIASQLKMPELAAVIFTGSFVGMTDLELGSVTKIILAGAVSGLLYSFTMNIFVGYGGRLGTIAFISIAICLVIINNIRNKTLLSLF